MKTTHKSLLLSLSLALSLGLSGCHQVEEGDLGFEEEEFEEEIELCNDGLDNDADGLADCEDDDCAEDDFCAPRPEQCRNGEDDDRDDLLDCEDDDCAQNTDCQCEDANAVFVDSQSSLVFGGDTTGSLDLANILCQEEGGTEVLFVLHPVENTQLRIQLLTEAHLILGTKEGFCDNLSGARLACTNFIQEGEIQELTVDAEEGRPILLFVGGADATQQGAFFLNVSAI